MRERITAIGLAGKPEKDWGGISGPDTYFVKFKLSTKPSPDWNGRYRDLEKAGKTASRFVWNGDDTVSVSCRIDDIPKYLDALKDDLDGIEAFLDARAEHQAALAAENASDQRSEEAHLQDVLGKLRF